MVVDGGGKRREPRRGGREIVGRCELESGRPCLTDVEDARGRENHIYEKRSGQGSKGDLNNPAQADEGIRTLQGITESLGGPKSTLLVAPDQSCMGNPDGGRSYKKQERKGKEEEEEEEEVREEIRQIPREQDVQGR